jgi:hypothetical protein
MPSGRLIATWSEERALELSSALGLPVFRIEYLPQILAYRVLESSGEMKEEMKMISPTELRMAVGLSLIFEGLPEAFSTRSLRIALAVVSHCGRHEVPSDLLMGLLSVDLVRLITMEKEMAVEEIGTRTGLRSVEAEKLLRLLKGHFREESLGEESLERLEVDPVDKWLRFYRHQDGYWKLKVDGKRAPERAAVQLGDGEMCVVPAEFEVIAVGMDVRKLEKFKSIKNIKKDGIVIKVGKLFSGIKAERRNYEERLLILSDEFQRKLLPIGFFDYRLEHNLEEKGFEVVRMYNKIRPQAEKGAKRLLGGDVDYWVFRALTNILVYFPKVARAKGRTRSEVAEDASRIIKELLRGEDKGYINLLCDAIRTLIEERRLLKPEEIAPRMRKIAEALGLCDPCSSRKPLGRRRRRRS